MVPANSLGVRVTVRRNGANLVGSAVLPPMAASRPGLEDCSEAVRVGRASSANLNFQRFNLSILSRFTGIDEMELHGSFSAPTQHRVARELRAIVEADRLGEPPFKGEVLEAADDVAASKREPISKTRHSREKSSTTGIARTCRPLANRS